MPVDPNQPSYPYGGGTDNPGDSTAVASSYNAAAASETGLLSARQLGVTYPPHLAPIAQAGTDTPLALNANIPIVAAGFESVVDRGADPEGGTDPIGGTAREAGQDETAGATETTSGASPAAFPQP